MILQSQIQSQQCTADSKQTDQVPAGQSGRKSAGPGVWTQGGMYMYKCTRPIGMYSCKSHYVMHNNYVKDNVTWISYETFLCEIDGMLNLHMHFLYALFMWNLHICECVAAEE